MGLTIVSGERDDHPSDDYLGWLRIEEMSHV